MRYNLLYTVAAVVSLTISSSHAATPPDLRMVAAKAAAAVKRVIPGSEGEVQGTLAVVKKRTRRTPRTDTSGSWDVPDDYGVMFMIRLLHGPYSGPRAAKTPQFNVTAYPPASLLVKMCTIGICVGWAVFVQRRHRSLKSQTR